jgi:hypothetical protein
MYKQGYSLGKQLAVFMPDLINLAKQHRGHIWFLGRDMDVFYIALHECGFEVRYIAGLNRENARKLANRGKLESWLRSIGIRNGDVLVDTGYRGTIFKKIAESTKLDLYFLLLTTDPEGATGAAVNEALNTAQMRRVILALEHSPKREVVSWDEEKRRPKVAHLDGRDGERANQFLRGCVLALKEAVM